MNYKLKNKWWEYSHDPEGLSNYLAKQEQVIDDLEEKLKIRRDRIKAYAIKEFFLTCKTSLSPQEIIFISLKLTGYQYKQIEFILKSISRSDSAAQRHVGKAIDKLTQFFQKDIYGKF